MTAPTKSTQDLREELKDTQDLAWMNSIATEALDRLEAAETKARSSDRAFDHSMGETKEACQELRAARARITELESTQQPRPMSEAPKQGHIRIVYTVVRNASHEWRKYSEEPDGWFPILDQSGETCENCGSPDCEPQIPDREDSPDNPEIGAIGKGRS